MKFRDWVTQQIKGTKKTRLDQITFVAAKAGISVLTLRGIDRGALLNRYDKAKAVSEATLGMVSIRELCEP